MEITYEIKRKVFGQYLGQVAQWKNLEYTDKDETETMWDNVEYYMDNKAYLILKPLSKITQDDAIEFHDIVFGGIGKKPYHVVAETVRNYIEMIFKGGKQCPDIKGLVLTTQFLQSKGYDLPQYLLGGKTLQEVGLAIYE
jgi:hypothetical protein